MNIIFPESNGHSYRSCRTSSDYWISSYASIASIVGFIPAPTWIPQSNIITYHTHNHVIIKDHNWAHWLSLQLIDILSNKMPLVDIANSYIQYHHLTCIVWKVCFCYISQTRIYVSHWYPLATYSIDSNYPITEVIS